MTSLDPLMSAANGSANAYGGQSEPQSGGWLLELERAWLNAEKCSNHASQSGVNSRAEPSMSDEGKEYAGGKSGQAMPEDFSPGASDSLSAQPIFSGRAASTSNLQFDSRLPAAYASIKQALQMSSLSAEGKPSEASFGMTLPGSSRSGAPAQSSSAAIQDGNPEAPRAMAENDAAYPEKRLHLLEDEHGIRVWIRDAALSEARGYAVANSLRAELGAAGLRLAAVTLNGKEIIGNSDTSHESGTASLEQDSSYVRNMIDESNLSIEKLSQKEHP